MNLNNYWTYAGVTTNFKKIGLSKLLSIFPIPFWCQLAAFLASQIRQNPPQKRTQEASKKSSIFWLILAVILASFWDPKWIKNHIKNPSDFWIDFGRIFGSKMAHLDSITLKLTWAASRRPQTGFFIFTTYKKVVIECRRAEFLYFWCQFWHLSKNFQERTKTRLLPPAQGLWNSISR